MKYKKTLKLICAILLVAIAIFNYTTQHVQADANLLTNPGAEANNLSGWNVLSNGGDGWATSGWDTPHSGNDAFVSSYGLDSLSQRVDLLSNGYTQNQLDTQQPTITFYIWLGNRCDSASKYYLSFKLLANNGSTVLASSGNTFGNSGSLITLSNCTNWFKQTYTFSNYGTGARYVYFEFGGDSVNFWAGNYGTVFDDASVEVNSTPNTPSSLGPTSLVNGSASTNNQPTFNATLSDPGYGSTVQYHIQISNSSDFSSPVVDYTSALAPPNNFSFSVGQPAGSGAYTTGSSGQVLGDGTYYWRIKAIADDGLASSWSSANGGNAAFKIASPRSPVITSQASSLVSGSSLNVNVLSGATGSPDPNSLSIVSRPRHGTAVDPPGTITYTPNKGYVGTDSLVYQVCSLDNESLCSQATLSFDVLVANSAPNTGFGAPTTTSPWAMLVVYGSASISLFVLAATYYRIYKAKTR